MEDKDVNYIEQRLEGIEKNLETAVEILKKMGEDHELRLRELESWTIKQKGIAAVINWLGLGGVGALIAYLINQAGGK